MDILKTIKNKASDLGEVKDDVLLLKNEANEIMREIAELQKIANSLLIRQAKVMGAIGRLKDFVGLD
ncbi:MAG: hypothetical protein F9K40_18035 [Kofleriaceae bacterium]|nr:MAG: hypothetical protein F9K40_18035 [Kofleriaceae bacterium]MBZ0232135.1 hypothetical protein [Kofleriaceae bacterium]